MNDKEILDWLRDVRNGNAGRTSAKSPKNSGYEQGYPEQNYSGQSGNYPVPQQKKNSANSGYRQINVANALRTGPLEFALAMLARNYYSCLEGGNEEQARFIRTEVQSYARRKGWRYTLSSQPEPIPEFIAECADSEDVMDTDEFCEFKAVYRANGIGEFVAQAGHYKEQRAGQLDPESFAYEFNW